MPAALFRGGVNLAGEKLAAPAHMTIFRTVVQNFVTYDYSGYLAIRTCLQAKSGVGEQGGITKK